MDVKEWPALRTLAAALALSIAGCAGGSAVPTVASPSSATPANERSKKPVLAKFVIHIPRKRRTGRGARYISPATKSIAITVDPGARQTVLNANVTPGSPNCTLSTCTLILNLLPGAHTFNVTTYDATLSGGAPDGNVLSQNLGYPFTVARGVPNSIGVVLQGIPASITVAATPDQDVQGNQTGGFDLFGAFKADGATLYARTFTVTTLDADGNIIAGAGAPALTMVSSKTASLSNGVALPTSPNRFTITPALDDESAIRFTVTATPSIASPVNSGAAPIAVNVILQIVATNAPRVFVTDQTTNAHAGKVWAFDEFGQPLPGIQGSINAAGSLGEPAGISQCPNTGVFFVADEATKSVTEFDDDGTYVTRTLLADTPLSVACDPSSGQLYVFNASAPAVVYVLSDFPTTVATVTGNWNEISPDASPVIPWSALADESGIWIADAGNGDIVRYDREGAAHLEYLTPAVPYGIADVSGFATAGGVTQMYSARGLNQMWLVGQSTVLSGFPGLNHPFGIRQDPANGYIYVVQAGIETGPNSVVRYDANGDVIALPAGAFSGPDVPLGIEIVP
jgi:hypothetical protein